MSRERCSAKRCAALRSASYSGRHAGGMLARKCAAVITTSTSIPPGRLAPPFPYPTSTTSPRKQVRSEELTSELQSLAYLVCRLLREKKKRHTRPLKNTLS